MPITPITPSEASRGSQIPEAVIDIFNTLIAQKYDGKQAEVPVADLLTWIKNRVGGDVSYIQKKGWLDVYDLYATDWFVEPLLTCPRSADPGASADPKGASGEGVGEIWAIRFTRISRPYTPSPLSDLGPAGMTTGTPSVSR